MRRLHAVEVQREFGMVSREFADGYERSVVSAMLWNSGAREWWLGGKDAFPRSFSEHFDRTLASGTVGEGPDIFGVTAEQVRAGESS